MQEAWSDFVGKIVPAGAEPPVIEVREPTAAEVAGFQSLAAIFEWAKVRGQLCFPGTRAGPLLRLVARDEWRDCEISDFATVSPAAFDEMIEEWFYCKDEGQELDDDHFDRQFATETPGPMLIGAAQALHHTCRIKAKIVHTREAQDA